MARDERLRRRTPQRRSGHGIRLAGRFHWLVEYQGRVIDRGIAPNGIVTATIDDLLDIYFSNGTPKTAWYLGLISNTSFTSLKSTDTMASHSTWQEATNYSGSRPAWSPGDSSSGTKKNATAAEFSITTEEALRGMFVSSDNTKGGTSGTLWATGTFTTGVNTPPVGATFKLFYELTGREG